VDLDNAALLRSRAWDKKLRSQSIHQRTLGLDFGVVSTIPHCKTIRLFGFLFSLSHMGQVLEGKGCLWFETGIFRSHVRFFPILPPPRLGLLDSGPVSVARGRGPGISGREREGNSPTGRLSKRAIRMTFAFGVGRVVFCV